VIPPEDFSIGSDDGGAESVGDESTFGLHGKGEEVGDFREVDGGGGGEFPAGKEGGVVGVGGGESVLAENFWCVVPRVEAEAEEMDVRIRGELLVALSEIGGHARAKIREGAAGVDEGDKKNFAGILLQRNSLAALIRESEVGDGFAGRGDVECISGRGGFRMAGDLYVFEPVVGWCIGACEEYDVGRDGIAGSELIQGPRRFDLVRHGHRVHEAGNVVAVDEGGFSLRVDRDDAAGEGVALRCWRIRAMTGQ